MTQMAITRNRNTPARRLQAERLLGAAALREAQALRYRVFSAEFAAKFKGAELGLDLDDYDIHSKPIGVGDLNSGDMAAPTPLPDHYRKSDG